MEGSKTCVHAGRMLWLFRKCHKFAKQSRNDKKMEGKSDLCLGIVTHTAKSEGRSHGNLEGWTTMWWKLHRQGVNFP